MRERTGNAIGRIIVTQSNGIHLIAGLNSKGFCTGAGTGIFFFTRK